MQRLIREEEPPKPSTRLSSSGEELTAIARHRSMAPEQLQKAVRGDLDWIVMKTLEKDRGRRYETPSSLVDDVHRFLSHEPVEACPPSSVYRLRKFMRRNRALTATAGVVGFALVMATAVTAWFAWNMKVSRNLAQDSATVANRALLELRRSIVEQAVINVLLRNDDAAVAERSRKTIAEWEAKHG